MFLLVDIGGVGGVDAAFDGQPGNATVVLTNNGPTGLPFHGRQERRYDLVERRGFGRRARVLAVLSHAVDGDGSRRVVADFIF